ncbi:MAG TPA: hypothetical protein PKL74_11195, partial [Tenuifilaceae bacterium]|nr:hypothetical protein [Tenuifilaceae bacterium]
ASFDQLQPVLKKALENERDNEVLERGVMAAGIAKAGEILSKKYWLQITNVPYLSRGKQEKNISDYCEKNFFEAKGDLATVFLDKMLKSNSTGGTTCSVIPQNWLFLTSYKKFREKLLKNDTWNLVARLGTKGFQTPMWDFNVMLIAITHQNPLPTHNLTGLDMLEAINAAAKDEALKTAELKTVNQKEQLGNPDAGIILGNIDTTTKLLTNYAKPFTGIQSGDNPKHFFLFWEFSDLKEWDFIQRTTESTIFYGGLEQVVSYQNGKGRLNKEPGAVLRNIECRGKSGFIVHRMGNLPTTIFTGELIDQNAAVIIPIKKENYLPLWCYLSSNDYSKNVRKIDKKLGVTPATLGKVPFDLEYWKQVATEKYPNGLPEPYSDDPTQWLFHGHPVKAENALQVAVARLLGYRWPAESDEEMELSEEARDLIKQVKELDLPYDEDGIVCIPPIYNEYPAAERLRQLLQKAWGENWNNTVLAELLKQAG